MIEELRDLLGKHKQHVISDRQLIGEIKRSTKFQEEIIKMTSFLDSYDIYDIVERLYYLVNNLTEVVKCKYCDNKATWHKRGLKEGYREICNSKECRSKQLADVHIGKNVISEKRDNEFIEWQASVTEVNDDVIKEHIIYDKFVNLITNPILLDYLNNRFKDSASLEETLKRIELGIEEKPKCALPGCNNPVTFIGRKRALFTKFCCPAHSAQSEETRKKCKQTNLEHWGTENVYDSEKYRQKMLEEYGVEYHFQRKDIQEKKNDTCLQRYNTLYPSQTDEVKNKMLNTTKERHGFVGYESLELRQKKYELERNNLKLRKSKREDDAAEYIESLGYKVERHVKDSRYPFVCDLYLPEYKLYVEYQGSQYHTNSAFINSDDDLEKFEDLKLKSEQYKREHPDDKRKRNFYDDVIYVWSDLDVRKRTYAYDNEVNFLEIYYCGSRRFDYVKVQLELMIDSLKNRNGVTKEYARNPIKRREVIQRQCKLLHKKEWELTRKDILSGYKD